MMAKDMMATTGQAIAVIWKKAIVPKSPMEHPKRHHAVFLADWRQTGPEVQSIDFVFVMLAILYNWAFASEWSR